MEFFASALAITISGGILALFLPERFKGHAVAAASGAALVPMAMVSGEVMMTGAPAEAVLELSYPIGTAVIAVDRLSSFFLLLISFMNFICALYAADHMKRYAGKGRGLASHFFFLSVLMASMMLVAAVRNALLFLLAWEIMSFSSFLLMTFGKEREEVTRAGITYLITMHVGVVFLATGFIVLSLKSGSYDFASFREVLGRGGFLAGTVFLFVFAGFGMKGGFVPFHTWLPGAYSAAPAHVSGIMAGVMKKTGIYGILRIVSLVPSPSLEMAFFILGISLLSGIAGSAYAVAQRDVKRVLAYSSVDNMGIAGCGIGMGLLGVACGNPPVAVLGFTGALVHVFNHSIFKTLLFFAAGNIFARTGTTDMERLGGLMKPMAFTGFAFLMGSMAAAGLPLLSGFTGEFMIYWSMLSGLGRGDIFLSVVLVLSLAGMAAIGAMALMSSARAFSVTFLGSPREAFDSVPEKTGIAARVSMAALMICCVAMGLLPQYGFLFASKTASIFLPESFTGPFRGYADTLGSLSAVLILFAGISAVLFLLRLKLLRGNGVTRFKTWDCGYRAGNERMQYTGSSFAAPFMRVVMPLYRFRESVEKPSGFFPLRGSFSSAVEDKFEEGIIRPVLGLVHRFLGAFTWIQSGGTQRYIMYGLIFLIAVVIWIMSV